MAEITGINPLVCYERQGKIAIISINRPQALNALNRQVYLEMTAAVERAGQEDGVHVVILKGDDKSFAAGADIRDLAGSVGTEAEAYMHLATKCVQSVYACRLPVIAYLRGFALGGGMELAMACDLRIAGDDVVLGLPEVTLGILPGTGGTQRLPRIVGAAKAKEMLLTGRTVKAAEALQLGLVNAVHPGDQTWEAVIKLAEKIAVQPLQAVCKAKMAVNAASHLTIWDGLQLECNSNQCLFGTEDQVTRMQAFLNRQKS